MRRALAAVLAALVIMVAAAPGLALGDTLSLEQQLKCPTCEVPLNVSNAPSALRIKAYIQAKEAAGWSDGRIQESLVQQFGRDILATPPKSGFDLVVWLVPAGLILAGLIAVPFLVRAWIRQRRAPATSGVDATPEELARLDRELRGTDD
jgi:cytochrome c-type biogenesis protein CcmH/NrfF